MKTVKERFYEKINKDVVGTGCWMWTGAISSDGYGKFWDKDHKIVNSHRWIYEHINGFSSRKLHVDHICRCRSCVNPAHLELVSPSENVRRGIKAIKKDPQEVKSSIFRFLCTPELKAKLEHRAWERKLNPSEYVRSLIERDLRKAK